MIMGNVTMMQNFPYSKNYVAQLIAKQVHTKKSTIFRSALEKQDKTTN
jgi:hypothetical protein